MTDFDVNSPLTEEEKDGVILFLAKLLNDILKEKSRNKSQK